MGDEPKGKVRVVGQVPLIDGLRTPYHLFRDKFMGANQPVLVSGLMQDWPAFSLWSSPSGFPNLDYLASRFGSSHVQVADCSTRDFTDQKRMDMTVAVYIAYWKRLNSNMQKVDSGNSLMYLKDWHFVKDYPEYCAYTTPTLFMDDWLNFYLENHQLHASGTHGKMVGCLSDYRFVYMGPKGTWTPLHADVFRSYSWSGNICGKKLWHLLPPSETHYVYDRHMRTTVYDIYGDVSATEFPHFNKAGWLECTQERGQILFVPSGWYHQVTNLEDTVSINHNWFNGYNLHWVWKLLLADYEEARASIEDIRSISDNFEELCQRNLAANSGMDFHDFIVFLRRMTAYFVLFLHQFGQRDKKAYEARGGNCFTDPDLRFVCKNVLAQVLLNLHSVRGMSKLMASADGFEGFSSASRNADQNSEGESEILNGWSDAFQQSEYGNFLTHLIDRCRCRTSDHMTEVCTGDDSNFVQVEGRVEDTDLNAFCVLDDTPTITSVERIVENGCEVSITTLEDVEIKVSTPRLLYQFVRMVMSSLLEASNLN